MTRLRIFEAMKVQKWIKRVTPRWSVPGEISKYGCWTYVNGGYLYIASTFIGLVWTVISEWKHDRNLAG